MSVHLKRHASIVKQISSRLKELVNARKRVLVYHGSTNSTRKMSFNKGEFVDTTDLNHVLYIDEKEMYALVEPNTPMDKLVEETLKHGLLPPVVMEFPGITAGGGVQGGAGESSSFRYGLFHDCCEECEIVLGNGMVVKTSPKDNPDLFWGSACSYGSLGIVTMLKLRLIPAKFWVRLTYYPVKTFREALHVIEKESVNDDFVDGIMFDKNQGVVMRGNFSAKVDLPVRRFTRARDEWFYINAEKIARRGIVTEELIPVRDYLFRYDRGAFWMGKYAFEMFKTPFNRITRFILDPLLKTRRMYEALHATNVSQMFLIQDLSLPKNNALKFLEFVDKKFEIYPLWICPLGSHEHAALAPNFIKTDFVVDIGVWGRPKGHENLFNANRDLEKEVQKLHGRKVLYAHVYYPEEDFWRIYDKRWYDKLREKYHATNAFPDIYTKVHVSETYKVSINKGMWRFIKLLLMHHKT